MGETCPLAGSDGQIFLQHAVRYRQSRHGGRRRVGGRDRDARAGGVPGDKTHAQSVRIRAAGQLTVVEVVDGGHAQHDAHVIHVVVLAAHVHVAVAANAIAVHLGQGETVVGRAVADILAVEVGPRKLEVLPAAEVVGNIHAPAFGVIGGRAGVAVVQDVDEQRSAGVIAVEPDTEPDIGGPVLRHPFVNCLVREGVGEAGPLAGPDGQRLVQHRIRFAQPRHWRRRRVGGGDCHAGAGGVPGDEAHTQSVGIQAGGQLAVVEVVDDVRFTGRGGQFIVDDGQCRIAARAERRVDGIGQAEQRDAIAVVNRVVDGLHLEGFDGAAGCEDELAAGGLVVHARHRGIVGRAVGHRHRHGGRGVERYGDDSRVAFGHVGVGALERHLELHHTIAEQRNFVDVGDARAGR